MMRFQKPPLSFFLIALGMMAMICDSAAAETPTETAPSIIESQDSSAAHFARAEFVADVSAIHPGEPFDVGLRLTLAPGWHVYWKNPGQAGMATSVTLFAPPGFVVGSVRYPLPSVLPQRGDVVVYGYESDVMLTATITPPATLAVGPAVSISAAGKWLVCNAEECIPRRASWRLSLPVEIKSRPDHTALFDHWRGLMPSPLSGSDADVALIDQKVAPNGPSSLVYEFRKPVKNVVWFPDPPRPAFVNAVNATMSADNKTATVSFKMHGLQNGPTDAALEGLLTYTDDAGIRRGYISPGGHTDKHAVAGN